MPNRSECEAVLRQLWPYLDGVISDPQRERILRHLELCTDCSSHFEFARAFLDAVAAAAPTTGRAPHPMPVRWEPIA